MRRKFGINMNEKLFLVAHALVLIIFVFVNQCECRKHHGSEDQCKQCNSENICWGHDREFTLGDVNCIFEFDCDMSYRNDSCGRCARDTQQHEFGSRFKDCTGKCYHYDTLEQMQTVDRCGVCGGDGTTCATQNNGDTEDQTSGSEEELRVTHVHPMLIPSNQRQTLKLTGTGFTKNGILITTLGPYNRVAADATIKHTESSHSMTVEMLELDKGHYEVKARSHNGVLQTNDGPRLTVYDENELTVEKIHPTSFDLFDGHAQYISVSVYVITNMDLSTSEKTLVTYAGQYKRNATLSKEGQFNVLSFKMEVPRFGMVMDICQTINGINTIGCKPLSFFTPAPVVIQELARFSGSGHELIVQFDKSVERRRTDKCSDYFMIHQMFGKNAACTLADRNTRLVVNLTTEATVLPGDELELRAGLHRESRLPKKTELLILRVVADDVRPIEIRKSRIWPERLSLYGKGPLNLKVVVMFLPGGRMPKSITWWVNDEVDRQAQGSVKLKLYARIPGTYAIRVEVVDVFGGRATISHTVTKGNSLVPSVRLIPDGVRKSPEGNFVIHPGKVFALTANITYPKNKHRPLSAFTRQWTKDGVVIGSGFRYVASKSTVTNEDCGKILNFGFRAFLTTDPTVFEEKHMRLEVSCRELSAKIAGANPVHIPLDKAIRVNIDGNTLSRDPDGGALNYRWSCSVIHRQEKMDCIKAFELKQQANTAKLQFSNSLFKNTVGLPHNFTLTVSVTKGNRTYRSSDTVTYIPTNNNPFIQFVTTQNTYRSNVPIVVKAFVGDGPKEVGVEWNFRRQEGLDWADATSRRVVEFEKHKRGYAWIFIRPNVLKPGGLYLLEVMVTNKRRRKSITKSVFELYIYKQLEGCEIGATDVMELEEVTLILDMCVMDEAATTLSAVCSVWGVTLTMNDDMTSIMPKARSRNIKKAKFTCTITDNLGNVLNVESNEVNVNLQSNVDDKLEEKIEDLEEKGKHVDAIEMVARNMDDDSKEKRTRKRRRVHQKARQMLKQAALLLKDAQRLLSALNAIESDDDEEETDANEAIDNYDGTLGKICEQKKNNRDDDPDGDLSGDNYRRTARHMRRHGRRAGRRHKKKVRHSRRNLNCVMARQLNSGEILQNDLDSDEAEAESESETDTRKSRRRRRKRQIMAKVEELDDLDNVTNSTVTFPEELKQKFSENRECADGTECSGVVVLLEEDTDPPDIPNKRNDEDCKFYARLELLDQTSGDVIPVNNLKEPIELNLGNSCPNPKCYYFEETTEAFENTGVTTATGENGDIICKSTHLTAFTVQSEDSPGANQVNFPMVIALTFGCLLLILSSVVLVRGYLKVKATQFKDKKKSTVEYVQNDFNE